jgi:hypothetical protein
MAPIAAAEQPVQALPTTLANETTAEDQAIQQAIANDQAAPQAVNAAFLTGPNAVVPTWESNLANEEQTALNAYLAANQNFSGITSDVNANNLAALSPAQLSEMGLTSSQVSDLMNLYGEMSADYGIGGTPNFSTYYTPGQVTGGAPTEAMAATPQDYATEEALSQLLGTGLGTTPITQATANEAGTVATPTNPTFNFTNALNTVGTDLHSDDLATARTDAGNPTDPIPGGWQVGIKSSNPVVQQQAANTFLADSKQYPGMFPQSLIDAMTRIASNAYS